MSINSLKVLHLSDVIIVDMVVLLGCGGGILPKAILRVEFDHI